MSLCELPSCVPASNSRSLVKCHTGEMPHREPAAFVQHAKCAPGKICCQGRPGSSKKGQERKSLILPSFQGPDSKTFRRKVKGTCRRDSIRWVFQYLPWKMAFKAARHSKAGKHCWGQTQIGTKAISTEVSRNTRKFRCQRVLGLEVKWKMVW